MIIYSPITIPEPVTIQAGFSVSKKKFKKAVVRNRIKRCMREAYRLNQNSVKSLEPQQFACMFLYIGAEELPFSELNTCMAAILEKLKARQNA